MPEGAARPIVCVDVNGVLDRYSGWRGPDHFDDPRPGAARFLAALAESGFAVVVFTTRHPDGVWDWLRRHGMDTLVEDVTDRKPPAHVFIDDRAICFTGDFDQTLQQALDFTAHWEAR
jgi:hypothetical protein